MRVIRQVLRCDGQARPGKLPTAAPARSSSKVHPRQSVVTRASAGAAPPSRRYGSLLPPLFERETVLEPYSGEQEGVWGLVQPFPIGLDIRLRCVVARLPGGGLLLHNPVAPTEEMLALVRGLGEPVACIFISSNSPEHWLYAPAVMECFPDAEVVVVPDMFDRLLSRVLWLLGLNKVAARAKVLGADPCCLDTQVEAITFANPFTVESGVLLRQYRALLVSDAAAFLDAQPGKPAPPAVMVAGARTARVWQRLGPVTQQLFEQFPEQGASFVSRVAELDFATILPAHGEAPIGDAKHAWAECFDFMSATKGGEGAPGAAGQ